MLKKLVKAAVVVEKLSKDAPGAPLGGGWTVEKFASEKPSDHFARELKARRERNLGEEAADKLRQSLAVRVRAFGRQNAEVAETLNNIGIVYKNAGNYSAALSAYNESLSIRKEVFGEVHSEVANTLINIGLVHLSENQFMEASKSFERAFDVRVSVFGRNQSVLKPTTLCCVHDKMIGENPTESGRGLRTTSPWPRCCRLMSAFLRVYDSAFTQRRPRNWRRKPRTTITHSFWMQRILTHRCLEPPRRQNCQPWARTLRTSRQESGLRLSSQEPLAQTARVCKRVQAVRQGPQGGTTPRMRPRNWDRSNFLLGQGPSAAV